MGDALVLPAELVLNIKLPPKLPVASCRAAEPVKESKIRNRTTRMQCLFSSNGVHELDTPSPFQMPMSDAKLITLGSVKMKQDKTA